MIHAGRYEAKCVSVQYGLSENGTDQLALGMEILAGEKQGSLVTAVLFFSDDAAPYSIPKLRATGWTGDALDKLIKEGTEDGDGVGQPSWLATPCDISVSYEEYRNRQVMRVNILDGQGKFKFKKGMDTEGRRKFGARFKSLVEQTVGGGSSPNPPPASDQKGEDEIPF
jgi:hypothetical protein